MAQLDVTEYAYTATDARGQPIAAGQEPALANNPVAIGAGSVQSAAFSSGTKLIRVHADAACRVEVGANPTAGATSKRIAANGTEYFGVNPGDKLAVITTT